VTDRVSAELVRLPLYAHMTESEADYVIESLAAVFREHF